MQGAREPERQPRSEAYEHNPSQLLSTAILLGFERNTQLLFLPSPPWPYYRQSVVATDTSQAAQLRFGAAPPSSAAQLCRAHAKLAPGALIESQILRLPYSCIDKNGFIVAHLPRPLIVAQRSAVAASWLHEVGRKQL